MSVYSPLDGNVFSVSNSNQDDPTWGSDILIEGYTDKSHRFIIQIRYVVTELQQNTPILKGAKLGHHAGNFVPGSPISVLNYTGVGFYVSMFHVMDEGELKRFQEVNITNRTYPIITDPQRKSCRLNCTGDGEGPGPIGNNDCDGHPYPNWIYTNNTSPAKMKLNKNKKYVQNN